MIIGIKEKDRVVFGFSNWLPDSINDEDKTLEENLPFKILPDEGIILACVNRNYSSDLLFEDENLSATVTDGNVSYERVVNDIMPKIKEITERNDIANEDGYWDNCFCVAKGNDLFDVGATFYVRDVTDFVVHTYTVQYAKSYLRYTKDKPAEELIVDALRYHGKMMGYRTFPVALVDTKTLQVKVIYK